MNKIKLALLSFILSISAIGGLGMATVNALPPAQLASVSTNTACDGLAQIDKSQSCGGGGGQAAVNNIVYVVVSTLSKLIGIVAIIMIILAGFKYIKSGGDSNNISSAKSTLIYALVGLAIAAMAQALVYFVFSASSKAAYHPSITRSVQDA